MSTLDYVASSLNLFWPIYRFKMDGCLENDNVSLLFELTPMGQDSWNVAHPERKVGVHLITEMMKENWCPYEARIQKKTSWLGHLK